MPLSFLVSLPWNLENWEAPTKKIKRSISIKLRYFPCLSHFLFREKKIVFKILFWIFDWRHQIGILDRSVNKTKDGVPPFVSVYRVYIHLHWWRSLRRTQNFATSWKIIKHHKTLWKILSTKINKYVHKKEATAWPQFAFNSTTRLMVKLISLIPQTVIRVLLKIFAWLLLRPFTVCICYIIIEVHNFKNQVLQCL